MTLAAEIPRLDSATSSVAAFNDAVELSRLPVPLTGEGGRALRSPMEIYNLIVANLGPLASAHATADIINT